MNEVEYCTKKSEKLKILDMKMDIYEVWYRKFENIPEHNELGWLETDLTSK